MEKIIKLAKENKSLSIFVAIVIVGMLVNLIS
jgi:hypothetical protein